MLIGEFSTKFYVNSGCLSWHEIERIHVFIDSIISVLCYGDFLVWLTTAGAFDCKRLQSREHRWCHVLTSKSFYSCFDVSSSRTGWHEQVCLLNASETGEISEETADTPQPHRKPVPVLLYTICAFFISFSWFAVSGSWCG